MRSSARNLFLLLNYTPLLFSFLLSNVFTIAKKAREFVKCKIYGLKLNTSVNCWVWGKKVFFLSKTKVSSSFFQFQPLKHILNNTSNMFLFNQRFSYIFSFCLLKKDWKNWPGKNVTDINLKMYNKVFTHTHLT